MSARRWLTPTRTWIALLAATLTSVWLGVEEAGGRGALVLILILVVFKVRLVFLHFMELSFMTGPWRWIFEAWAVACAAMILAFALV